MKKIFIILLLNTAELQSFGQDLRNEKSVTLVKDFMERIFNLKPFDSIVKITTLNKNLPKARIKYSSAYFSIVMLQLQAQKYLFRDLSYVPYLLLPSNQRNLVYEKFIDGVPKGIELANIYGVESAGQLLTYVSLENEKISGIRAPFSQGGSAYIHQFSMDYIDADSTLQRWELERPVFNQSVTHSVNNGLTIASNFITFMHDSLSEKNSEKEYLELNKKLLDVDTLDMYTVSFMVEYLKGKIFKIPTTELSIIPFSNLTKRQKKILVLNDEDISRIYALKHKKEFITFLYVWKGKIKYFLTLKNLKGQFVFVPFGYAFQYRKM